MKPQRLPRVGRAVGRASLLLALFVVASTAARGERLSIKAYNTTDGLASDFVTSIVADRQGFLWFCTRDGLSRFDGHSFVTYRMDHGLPDPTINDLLQTKAGEYWIGTNGSGVCLFHPDPGEGRESLFTVYPVGDTGPTNRVNELYEDSAGQVWVGTDGGLFRLEDTDDGRQFRRVELDLPPDPRTRGVHDFAEDRDGNLYIASGSGVWRRTPDGELDHFAMRPSADLDWVLTVLVDRVGNVWVGHRTGLAQLVTKGDETEIRWYTSADGLASEAVSGLHETPDGRIWIATGGGLNEFDGHRFRSYRRQQGLSSDSLVGFEEDREGNLWIHTFSSGVMKLVLDGLVTYNEADGLGKPELLQIERPRSSLTSRVHSIFENPAGELHVVSGFWFVSRFAGTGFESVQPPVADNEVVHWGNQAGFLDRSGQWWFLTSTGLYRFAPPDALTDLPSQEPVAIYTEHDGLPGDWAYRLYEDHRGDIWICTYARDGLTRWERDTEDLRFYSSADGLPQGNPPLVLGEDRSGALWVGFRDGGVARRVNGRFEMFTETDGLPGGGIGDIHLDGSGRLWIATVQGGLARVDTTDAARPGFVRFTTANGLSSNNVRSIVEDRWGRLYVGTVRGVDRFDPETETVRHYTTDEGLADNFVSVSYRDSLDRLWFGTLDGLSLLVPRAEPPPSPSPVWIGSLEIAGAPHPLSELGETEVAGVLLGPKKNQIRIGFFGSSFVSGEELRFQYKLEGADGEWSEPTEQRSVTFANTAPGRYRFLVRAVGAGGVSPTPASFSFRILPPVWARWWFVTLVVSVVVLLAYVTVRYRIARLLELERVRTRIATDLHDDIGSSLSQIAILSEVANRSAEARDPALAESLTRIAATSRELVDSMSDIVWAINPKRDRLSDVVQRMRRFASDTLTASDIGLSFRAPTGGLDLKLAADTKRQVFLVFKEAVNNAVRHSGCGRVEIELAVESERLSLVVRDDGCGFQSHGKDAGHGLQSMRDRAQELGGELTVDSSVGSGTAVVLKAPLRAARGGRRRSSA